jgi:uncharacterized protein YgiM (DUF1202 family)
MNTFRRMDFGRRLAGTAIAVMLLLGLLGPGVVVADGGTPLTGTAVIANADGQNVRLREAPSRDAAELGRFAEGTEVTIVDGPVTGDDASWYEVKVGEEVGFMDADFLEAAPPSNVTPTPAPGTPTGPVSGQATVTENLHVRSGPSTSDGIVVTLQAGAIVTLTGGERNGFVSVSAAGGDGWVAREFLVPVGATPTPPPTTPTATPADTIRYVLETVHLRTGPAETSESLGTLAVGTQLTLLGEIEGQFARVTSPLGEGWVYSQVIGPVNPNPTATATPTVTVTPPPATATVTPTTPVTATPSPTTPVVPTETPGQTGTRYTQVVTNLRSGPSDDASSVVLMDSGVPVQLQGVEENGFAQVSTVFGEGWVAVVDIGESAPGTTPTVTATPVSPTSEPVTPTVVPSVTPTTTPAEGGSRWTTENVNLRSAADTGSSSLGVIAAGTEVQFTGQTSNGLSQVQTQIGTGWIATEFLADTEPERTPTPTPTAEPGSSLLDWPVQGGEWRVLQGYNGSSHQNRSSSWQYLYSIDLVRTDGSTAGQPVYAPADGTVRWIDEASGGGSIYLGDGLAFAWFHTIVDPSVVEGGTVTRGQQIGVLAPAGVAGAGSTPHLHISIWETDDEGNWSRRAIPFTGRVALGGREFPADGSSYQWTGTIVVP